MNPYPSLCDDFSISMYVNSALPLPTHRETVLHYFESIQRAFPILKRFQCRDQGEFLLETDKQAESSRWAVLEPQRIGSGFVNPSAPEEADPHHLRILELAPYHLGITGLDCESLDVAYVFDIPCRSHHDEVVAEALGMHSPLEPMFNIPGARVAKYEPVLMMSLNEEQQLHCRLRIETRTSLSANGSDSSSEEPISVYFTVRRYWRGQPVGEFLDSYQHQRELCQELVDHHVIPAILQPLAQVIATK
jgi:hypothetical protein